MRKCYSGSVLVPLVILLTMLCLTAALLTRAVTQLLQLSAGHQQLNRQFTQHFARQTGYDLQNSPAHPAELVAQTHVTDKPLLISTVRQQTGAVQSWQTMVTFPLLSALPAQAIQRINAAPEHSYANILDTMVSSTEPSLADILLQRPASHRCQDLSDDTSGLVILRKNCALPEGRQIGSAEAPVMIISLDNTVTLPGNNHIYGLWVHLGRTPVQALQSTKLSNRLYGALVTTQPTNAQSEQLVYRPDILQQLQGLASLQSYHTVAGSWRDFQ